jgi:Ca2+-binding RTX toxin-like protein
MTIARLGSDFLVNTTTVNRQYESVVTKMADGRFVVTWTDESTTGSDTSNRAIRSRIFNADGSESVSEFLVNTTTSGLQAESSIALLADGRIIVSWSDFSQSGGDTNGVAIRARIFNADGSPSVPEFLVNSTILANQATSNISVLTDGRFVVTWTDTGANGGDTSDSAVRARIFNADGSQSVPEFLVNTTTAGLQNNSIVAVLADGRFVISWTDESLTGGDNSGAAIRARIFNSDGSESVQEFLVNSTTANKQDVSNIAVLADGRFVVTWEDYSASSGDTSASAIRARIFNSDGSEAVPEFLVNTTTSNSQRDSQIAVLADGRFVVTWTDFSASGGDTSSSAIRARIFNTDGSEAVPEFIVNTTTATAQLESNITVLADGTFVVTWTDDSLTGADTSGAAIRSQVFDPTLYYGTALGDTANGGSFNDRYSGYGGNDTLSGRGGDDTLNGGDGDDTLNGDDGNDRLDGGNNGDTLNGGNGNDLIYGRAGIDILIGGNGGDSLYGGLGIDQHIGGNDAGIDYARYDDANYGNLTIRLDGGANVGAAAVNDSYNGIEGLVGGVGNDTIVGNGNANFLFGVGGNDSIYGQGGADYLNGGDGTNNLWGGAAADQHIGGSGLDYARYDDANYGNLTIRLDGGANVGAVAVGDTYTGIEGLVGGLGNDIIVGNGSNNQLFGGGGTDYIDARAGNDYMNGGGAADRFVFATALNAATNVDTIADFAHAVDDIVLSQAIFAGIGATLDASEFQVGLADTATDRIIYNNITGQLFYDSNGNAAGGQTLFATVTVGTVLDTGDFVMV